MFASLTDRVTGFGISRRTPDENDPPPTFATRRGTPDENDPPPTFATWRGTPDEYDPPPSERISLLTYLKSALERLLRANVKQAGSR